MTKSPPRKRVRLPSKATFDAALDVLETHASHPGTMELHDPLYAAAQGRRAKLLAPVAVAFARHPGHPAMPALKELLGRHLALPERTLAQVLAGSHVVSEDKAGSPPSQAELLAQVEQRFARSAEVEKVLRARVLELESKTRQLGRTANGLAAVGALLAVLLILAWMVALDLIEVNWMDPPTPANPELAVP